MRTAVEADAAARDSGRFGRAQNTQSLRADLMGGASLQTVSVATFFGFARPGGATALSSTDEAATGQAAAEPAVPDADFRGTAGPARAVGAEDLAATAAADGGRLDIPLTPREGGETAADHGRPVLQIMPIGGVRQIGGAPTPVEAATRKPAAPIQADEGSGRQTARPIEEPPSSVTVPTDMDASPDSLAENAAVGSAVGVTARAIDANAGDVVTYALTDDAGGLFAIDPTSGVVRLAGALDFESASSHEIEVVARSSDGSSAVARFTIAVTDAAEHVQLPDGGASFVDVATPELSVTGGDGDDTITGSLAGDSISGGGGYDAIDGGSGDDTLRGGDGFDTLTGGDGNDALFGEAGRDLLTGGDGDDLLDGGAWHDTLAGGDGADTLLGGDGMDELDGGDGDDLLDGGAWHDTLAGGDGDDSLLGGGGMDALEGGDGNDLLDGGAWDDTLSGGDGDDTLLGGDGDDVAVFSGNWRDYAVSHDPATGAYTLTDRRGLDGDDVVSGVETFRFADGDVAVADLANDAPTGVTLAGGALAEDAAPGAIAGTAGAIDADALDTHRFSLNDDAGGRFVIDADTGEIRLAPGASLDREAAASHDVIVRVTDASGASAVNVVTISVTDVDEFDVTAPADVDPAPDMLAEDAVVGAAVGITAAAEDADATDGVTYSLTDDAGGRFAIDAATGLVTLAAALDYETAASHDIEVLARSSDGSTAATGFTIAVADVAEMLQLADGGATFVDTGVAETAIIGGSGADSIAGHDAGAALAGGDGDDTLIGGAGDDALVGGDGDNRIEAGAGDDIVLASGGADSVAGGDGDDQIATGGGHDTVDGGDGRDVLGGGSGDDSLLGGAGDDRLNGEAGDDTLDGGDGDDTAVYSGAFSDYDIVEAPDGALTIGDRRGLDGTDTVSGVEFFEFNGVLYTLAQVRHEAALQANTAPTTPTWTGGSIAENAAAGTAAATLASTDVDGDPISYLITDAAGNPVVDADFEIVGDEARLKAGALLDFESEPTRSFYVKATDALEESTPTQITITVDDVAEAIQLADGGVTFTDVGVAETSITGGTGDDAITANDGGGHIDGGAGDDAVTGAAGNDMLIGGDGGDTIGGGAGADTLRGDAGNDSLSGGDDDDDILGGAGWDTLRGGDGDDTLEGGDGADTLTAGAGNDQLSGGDDDDWLRGEAGDDLIDGGEGDDRAAWFGDLGEFSVVWDAGASTFTVTDLNTADGLDEGADAVTGVETFVFDGVAYTAAEMQHVAALQANTAPTAPTATGGTVAENAAAGVVAAVLSSADADNDPITYVITDAGGTPVADADFEIVGDEIRVKAGATLDFETAPTRTLHVKAADALEESAPVLIAITVADAAETIQLADGGATFTDAGVAETAIIGGDGADAVTANAAGGAIDGGAGDDTLEGRGGGDDLTGGDGADWLRGLGGADILSGGDGADTLYGEDDDDQLHGGGGDDRAWGGDGDDRASGGDGADTLRGEAGDDTLEGDAGDDLLVGDGGADVLQGGAEDDTLDGGDGADVAVWAGDLTGFSVVWDAGAQSFTITDLNAADGLDEGADTVTGVETFIFDGVSYSAAEMQTESDRQANVAPTAIAFASGGVVNETVSDGGTIAAAYDPSGATVATLATTDANTGETHAYSLIADPSGKFEIVGNEVRVRAGQTVDFETDPSFTLTIRTTDRFGATHDEALTLTVADFEGVATASPGSETITGTSEEDEISWSRGDGSDTVAGGDGFDTLVIHASVTEVHLRSNLRLNFDDVDGSGEVVAQSGFESIRFDDATWDMSQAIRGTNANDTITGGAADDIVTADQGDDLIDGGEGRDYIFAASGNDTLVGDAGDDYLFGGGDNDTLIGGAGDDFLDGHDQSDTVVYAGAIDDYVLTHDAVSGLYTVTDANLADGDDGADTIRNVETFRFNGVDYTAAQIVAYIDGSAPTAIGFASGGTVGETVADGGTIAAAYDPSGAVVATLTTTDASPGDTHTYTLVGDPSGKFEIVGDQIRVRAGQTFDHETDASYALTVRVADVNGSTHDETLTITVADFAGAYAAGDGGEAITGTSEEDVIAGGAGDDAIDGGAGDDTLRGESGDDALTGAAGADALFGGAGDDTLTGGAGADTLRGEDDADTFAVGDGFGDDLIVGGETVSIGADIDTIDLSSLTAAVSVAFTGDSAGTITDGADTITFSEIERLILTDGADSLSAFSDRAGFDVDGGAGDDTITGGWSDDSLAGGDGDDRLNGGASTGADTLSGGAGADTLIGGAGADRLDGGDGIDLASYWGSDAGVVIDLTDGLAESGGHAAGDVLSGIEEIEGSSGYGDSITTDDRGMLVRGNGGDDTLTGGAGDDTLQGDNGDDGVSGGAGDDVIEGGEGADTLRGEAGDDTLDGGDGADVAVWADDLADFSVIWDAGAQSFTITDLDAADGLDEGADTVTGVETFTFNGVSYTAAEMEHVAALQANSAPTAPTSSGNAVAENAVAGTVAATFASTDADNDPITYVITDAGGNPVADADFEIVGDELRVNAGGTLDFESAPTRSLYVKAADALEESAPTLISVAVSDAAEMIQLANGGAAFDDIGVAEVSITGGDGADAITSHASGGSTLYGMAGDDVLTGRGGDDTIWGGDDADTVVGGDGDDSLGGDAGDDSVSGGDGADTLWGGDGADIVDGGAGADSMGGDDGDDALSGGVGGDTIWGGLGADTLDGGAGDDAMDGGDGTDVAVWAGDLADFSVVWDAGTSTFTITDLDVADGLDEGVDTVGNVETFRFNGVSYTAAEMQDVAALQANSAPTAPTSTGNAVAENAAAGTVAATLSSTDADNNPITFVITDASGNPVTDADFEIVGDEIRVKAGAGLDFEASTTRTLHVKAADALEESAPTQVTITVNDIAEAIQLADGGATFTDAGVAETSITGGDGGDTIVANASGGIIDGGAGDDTITGGDGNDTLSGGDGNDSILGGSEGDLLVGGLGDDTLDGGGNWDQVDYRADTDGVSVNLTTGVATGASIGTDTLISIEALLTGAGDDTLIGRTERDYFDTGDGDDFVDGGGAGDDRFHLGGGDDTVIAGAGDEGFFGGLGEDLVDYRNAASGVTVDLGLAGPQNTGGAGLDEFDMIDNLAGSAFGDALTGDGGVNRLDGAAGDDTLTGGGGDDTLDGGDGTDTAVWAADLAHISVVWDAGAATFTVTDLNAGDGLDEGTDAVTGVETFSFNGVTYTAAQMQDIAALQANDAPTAPTSSGNAVAENAAAGVVAATLSSTDANGDPIIYVITDASGNPVADADFEIVGDELRVKAGAALDYETAPTRALYVKAADALEESAPVQITITVNDLAEAIQLADGGAGFTDAGVAETSITGGSGADAIVANAAGGTTIDGGAGNDTITGGAGDETLSGGEGDDSIAAGDGTDSLIGGAGDDTLDGGGWWDTVDYRADTAGVSVNLATGVATGATIGTDTLVSIERVLTGTGDDTLIGSAGDDQFESTGGDNYVDGGGSGDDQFYMGDGNDTMIGGSGDDRFAGSWGEDLVDYSRATSGVTVDLGVTGPQDTGGAGVDDLEWIEHLAGSDHADALTGHAGANALDGGAGDDTLAGGDGDDTLTGGADDDVIDGGDGTDTAVWTGALADYALTDLGGGAFLVSDTRANGAQNEGTDTVTNVESFAFDGVAYSAADIQTEIARRANDAPSDITYTDGATAFAAEAVARFDDIAGGWFQRVFDHAVTADQTPHNVWLGQEYDGSGMAFEVVDGAGVKHRIVAANAIVQGETATWRAEVTDTGLMRIYKNGALVAEGQGIVPAEVERPIQKVGESNFSWDSPLIGEVSSIVVDFDPVAPVSEDAAVGTLVGMAEGVDANPGDTLTFSLLDDAGGLFAIDAATGQITLAGALDYDAASSHTIRIQVADQWGATHVEDKTILVENEMNPLSDLKITGTPGLAAAPEAADVIARMSAVGGEGAITWAITGGATNDFAIDAETGEVRLRPTSLTFTQRTGASNPFDGENAGVHTATAFGDIDGDGDLDAMVGDDDGNVSYLRNDGDAANPTFTDLGNLFAIDIAGSDAIAPQLVDIDADGDLDLFLQEDIDELHFFRNTGSATNPAFAAPVENPFGIADPGNNFRGQFADLDADGDLDYLAGRSDGSFHYYQNLGTAQAPSFAARVTNPFGLFDVGTDAAPTLFDMDRDGDLDLMVATTGGQIRYFQNTGTASAPVFSDMGLNASLGTGSTGGTIADLDGDGDGDMLLSGGTTALRYFENVTTGVWTSAGVQAETLEITATDALGQSRMERILFQHGSSNAETIQGDGQDGVMYGGGGNDTLRGEVGDDFLDGGTGDDRLEGGAGNDTLVGGAGADVLQGSTGSDVADYSGSMQGVTVRIETFQTVASGGDAAGDSLLGIDDLIGSEHADHLTGYDGTYDGRAESNIIDGRGGDDQIFGMGGDDVLTGGDGDDTLDGGTGNDLLTGGDGSDIFTYGAGDGNDSVQGGGGWTDVIQLDGMSGPIAVNGGTVTGAGWTMVLDGGHGVVSSGGGVIDLTADAQGVITFDDGATLTFQEVERIAY